MNNCLTDMHAIWKSRIGIRAQAVGIDAVIAVWVWSLVIHVNDYKGNHSGFSDDALVFCPFIAAVFTVILLISYFRSGRPHLWWVTVAVTATICVWLLILTEAL